MNHILLQLPNTKVPPSQLQEFPWVPKPVNELTGATAGEINEYPSLIWFTGKVEV